MYRKNKLFEILVQTVIIASNGSKCSGKSATGKVQLEKCKETVIVEVYINVQQMPRNIGTGAVAVFVQFEKIAVTCVVNVHVHKKV